MASSAIVLDGQDQAYVGILYVPSGTRESATRRWRFKPDSVKLAAIGDEDDPRDIDESSCKDMEIHLGHLPDFKALKDEYRDLSWEHCTLVKVPDLEADPADGVERADYLIYVCLEESSGFERNEYLEWLVSRPLKVYGGALVFKKTTDSGESDDSEIAAYLQSESGYFNKTMKNSLFEERILIKLMEAVCVHASANGSVESHLR